MQALALSEEAYQIFVMDISEESLQKAQTIFEGTAGSEKHEISYVTEMNALPTELDVVVMATGSSVRRVLTEQLLAHAKVSYLVLEKVLFQRLEDYAAIGALIEEKQVKTFVNCVRRMYPHTERIKELLADATQMEITVSGSDWGMGCNAIHMIDLMAHLAGSENIKLDVTGLDPNYQESKRRGYLEITGTIRGSMGKCRALSISSYAQPGVQTSIVIQSDCAKINLVESAKKLEYANSATNWEWKEEMVSPPFQSQLTQILVKELLETGTCRLTSFEESAKLHIALEEQLIPYFENLGVEKGLCPIT